MPVLSTATPLGRESCAAVAAAASPEKPGVPVPATVVMVPPLTLRMRWCGGGVADGERAGCA
ncbi:hypothetical protein [Granulicella sp. L46]|uniref:hypothetical protein n=1 Tax=Granulicella sp. L46 TaxID=1641865 RepID=UPI0020B13E4E|nr:hypothetical protein [Granulicella sp. L46]